MSGHHYPTTPDLVNQIGLKREMLFVTPSMILHSIEKRKKRVGGGGGGGGAFVEVSVTAD